MKTAQEQLLGLLHASERPSLSDLISFEGFSYGKWPEHEITVLMPRMEALGYHDIRFYTVEADSFGPLVRGCTAILHGQSIPHHYIYG